MPLPGLTTLALTASRLALRLAEKRRWLPGSAWHRRSLVSLKAGDLDEAARLNRLALERNPNHGKAQVVNDLIAMRRDAATAGLQKQIDEERRVIGELQAEHRACRLRLLRSKRRQQQKKLTAWLLVPLSAAGALVTGSVVAGEGFPLWGRIIAGVVGGAIVIALVMPRFIGGRIDELVRDDEDRAALVTLNREIEARRRRSAELERRLLETLHHPVGLKR